MHLEQGCQDSESALLVTVSVNYCFQGDMVQCLLLVADEVRRVSGDLVVMEYNRQMFDIRL